MNDKDGWIRNIIDVCHRLYAKGFVTATDGNVSSRLPCGHYLTTRTAINKGDVSVEDILELDETGIPINSGYKPSTELGMHLFMYEQRPDVGAVVHAHPPYATGFATAREPLTGCLFPEVIIGLGVIPLAEYATPSTAEVAESLAPYIQTSDAILLANHGVVTCGKDVWDAYYKMEKVEHAAQILLIARLLGGESRLTEGDIEKLRTVSESIYGKDMSKRSSCDVAGNTSSAESDNEPRNIIRRMMD